MFEKWECKIKTRWAIKAQLKILAKIPKLLGAHVTLVIISFKVLQLQTLHCFPFTHSFACLFIKESSASFKNNKQSHMFWADKMNYSHADNFRCKQANKSFCSFSLAILLCVRDYETLIACLGSLVRLCDVMKATAVAVGIFRKVSASSEQPLVIFSTTCERQNCAWAANEFCCL